MKARISRTTFKSCGLNAKNNFLQAPKCECGCVGYANPVIKSREELCDFMGMLLSDHECEHCAIFAINEDGSATMGLKFEEGILFAETKIKSKCASRKAIKELDEEFGFHYYGLLEQATNDTYRIVMD